MVNKLTVSETPGKDLLLGKDAPQDVVSSPLSLQNQSPKLVDLTFPIKKDVASLFIRDITKKHIETISHTIDELNKKLLLLNNDYQKKSDFFASIPYKVLDTQLALDQNLVVFNNQIKFSNTGLSYEQVVFLIENLQKKIETLSAIGEQYACDLAKQNSTYPKEQRSSPQEIEQSASEYMQSLYAMFDEFTQLYITHLSLESSLHHLQNQQILLENELSILLQQYNEAAEALVAANEKLESTTKEGFLATFEFFDPSLKIEQFVSQKKVQEAMQKIISLYAKKDEFAQYGITPPKSILLSGSKETGKTFAAKILAAETNRTMYHITYHDVFSEESTDPNQMLSDIFYAITEHIQEQQGSCVLFLDEIEKMIDSVGKNNIVFQQIIINTIEKNIFAIKKSNLDIVVIAAFGSLDKNNASIVNTNTFDEKIAFDLPNKEEIEALLQQNISSYASGFFVQNYALLAEKCIGKTSSYIHKLITACATDFSFRRIDGDMDFVVDEQYILDKHVEFSTASERKYFR